MPINYTYSDGEALRRQCYLHPLAANKSIAARQAWVSSKCKLTGRDSPGLNLAGNNFLSLLPERMINSFKEDQTEFGARQEFPENNNNSSYHRWSNSGFPIQLKPRRTVTYPMTLSNAMSVSKVNLTPRSFTPESEASLLSQYQNSGSYDDHSTTVKLLLRPNTTENECFCNRNILSSEKIPSSKPARPRITANETQYGLPSNRILMYRGWGSRKQRNEEYSFKSNHQPRMSKRLFISAQSLPLLPTINKRNSFLKDSESEKEKQPLKVCSSSNSDNNFVPSKSGDAFSSLIVPDQMIDATDINSQISVNNLIVSQTKESDFLKVPAVPVSTPISLDSNPNDSNPNDSNPNDSNPNDSNPNDSVKEDSILKADKTFFIQVDISIKEQEDKPENGEHFSMTAKGEEKS